MRRAEARISSWIVALHAVFARFAARARQRADSSCGASALAVVGSIWLAACGSDPTQIEGALSRASSAVASRDHAALFAMIDERSRFALAAVYGARQRAAEVIRTSYPPEAQSAALRDLGDAVEAESAVDLFRRRCDDACVQAFASVLGAPSEVHSDGDESVVRTVRGTETRLHRGKDGQFGLVWETAALARERTRASAELELIEANGETYRAQQALRTAK